MYLYRLSPPTHADHVQPHLCYFHYLYSLFDAVLVLRDRGTLQDEHFAREAGR